MTRSGERVRVLGQKVTGTMTEFPSQARPKEASLQHPEAGGMIASLLGDHEALVWKPRGDLMRCLDRHGDAAPATSSRA